MRRIHGVLASVILGLLLISPPWAIAGGLPSLLKNDWIAVESPHFSTMSMLSEKKTIELVRELELFRQLVFKFTSAESDASPIPSKIFLLKRKSNISKLGVDERNLIGFFLPGLRSNVIVTAGGSRDNQHVIQHEYVHFLLSRTTEGNYPAWYNEGFAEFMASSKVTRDRITYGDVPAMRVDSIQRGRWVPFRKLIDRDEAARLGGRDTSMLYAQSWLLVHYLHLGRSGRDLQADRKSYLGHLKRGVPDTFAFEEAADGPQPSQGSPCAPSLTCTGHGPRCREWAFEIPIRLESGRLSGRRTSPRRRLAASDDGEGQDHDGVG